MSAEILIVDDEEDIRNLIAGILQDEGYETRVAGESESALREIEARRPSLLLQDIWLQGSKRDGLEVLRIVKSRYKDLPVIMISGHGNIETAEMLRTFNCGIGMVIAVRAAEAELATSTLEAAGETVVNIGHIQAGNGQVQIDP